MSGFSLQKFGMMEGVPRPRTPNFNVVGPICGLTAYAYCPQNCPPMQWHVANYTAYQRFGYHKFRNRRRDKQTNNTTLFSRLQTACNGAAHPHHTWHGDRGGPSRLCPPPLTMSDPISSFAPGAVQNLWENAPSRVKG